MGRPGMAEKQKNQMTHRGGRRRVRWPDPGASDGGFSVKFGRQGFLVVALLPGRRVKQGGGRKRLPRPKPVWLENGSKRPSSRFTGFGEFF